MTKTQSSRKQSKDDKNKSYNPMESLDNEIEKITNAKND